jgi:hypothetical protein
MATTAVERPKTRSDLAQLAGRGPFSFISMLAGVLVGYAMSALLIGGAAAVLVHNGSKTDLTEGWDKLGTKGGLLLGGLLFVSYLVGGYVAGRMAWRRGWLHGLAIFAGSIVIVGAVALLVRRLAKPDDVENITDVEGMTKEELYQRAQERDISGRSDMDKEELKDALQQQS